MKTTAARRHCSSTVEILEARIAPAALVTLDLSSLDGSNGFKINGAAGG